VSAAEDRKQAVPDARRAQVDDPESPVGRDEFVSSTTDTFKTTLAKALAKDRRVAAQHDGLR
jgi:ATP adenylyltransferase/5',5'''-P-1,P-4-tetraphosphate phosphorylase II